MTVANYTDDSAELLSFLFHITVFEIITWKLVDKVILFFDEVETQKFL